MVQKLIFDFLMFDFGPRPRTFELSHFEGFRLRFDDQNFFNLLCENQYFSCFILYDFWVYLYQVIKVYVTFHVTFT